jgi:hypothetical protein
MSSEERPPDASSERSGRQPALTDAEIERKSRLVDLENKETEVAKLKTEVDKLKRSWRRRRTIAAFATESRLPPSS